MLRHAFHRTIAPEAATYALPREWNERFGLRRFGFHGLNVAWCTERAARGSARGRRRLVVCHLGSGCSVSAVLDGRSVDTTMGFTPLEGVPMATRSGSIDPGVLLHLLRRRHRPRRSSTRRSTTARAWRDLPGSTGMREVEQAAAAATGGAARVRRARARRQRARSPR